MEINKENLNAFNKELMEALEGLIQKHGVQMKIKKCVFDRNSFDITLNVLNGETKDDARRLEYDKYAKYFNELTGVEYGTEFKYNNEILRIVGIAPKSTKYRMILERKDGRTCKTTLDFVVNCLRG